MASISHHPSSLSLDASGELDDGRATNLEVLGRIRGEAAEDDLLATRQTTPPGEARKTGEIWLIAAESVEHLLAWRDGGRGWFPALDQALSNLPSGPLVRGVPLRDWAALIALALTSYALAWQFLLLCGILTRKVLTDNGSSRNGRFVTVSEPPLRFFIASALFYLVAGEIGVSVVARHQLFFLFEVAALISGAWLLWWIVDALGDYSLSKMSERGAVTAYSSITFITRFLKVLIGAVFLAIILRTFGVDITAGLAALGVGGLILAFGAKKS